MQFFIGLLTGFIAGGICGMIVMAMLTVSKYEPKLIDPIGLSPLETPTQG